MICLREYQVPNINIKKRNHYNSKKDFGKELPFMERAVDHNTTLVVFSVIYR